MRIFMILTLFFISFQIRSEMIDDITEVYRYGPETSDNDACDIALERAKQKALKKKGEHIYLITYNRAYFFLVIIWQKKIGL